VSPSDSPRSKQNVKTDIDIICPLHNIGGMEYRVVEAILADLHEIQPAQISKFRSRLRVLRDMGVPTVDRPGKGSRVDYKSEHLWEMHLALHLERFGLPPTRVGRVAFDAGHSWMREMRSLKARSEIDVWCRMSWDFDPSTGSSHLSREIGPLERLTRHIRYQEDQQQQTSLAVFGFLNLSKLTREIEAAIQRHAKWEEISQIYNS
jgi:hypothetical protein